MNLWTECSSHGEQRGRLVPCGPNLLVCCPRCGDWIATLTYEPLIPKSYGKANDIAAGGPLPANRKPVTLSSGGVKAGLSKLDPARTGAPAPADVVSPPLPTMQPPGPP